MLIDHVEVTSSLAKSDVSAWPLFILLEGVAKAYGLDVRGGHGGGRYSGAENVRRHQKGDRMNYGGDFAGAEWRKASRSATSGACVELAWRKSSYSATSGQCVELAWRKSSCSATSGECVELAHSEAVFGVRDSKNTDGPLLALTARHGLAFLDAIKHDRLAHR